MGGWVVPSILTPVAALAPARSLPRCPLTCCRPSRLPAVFPNSRSVALMQAADGWQNMQESERAV